MATHLVARRSFFSAVLILAPLTFPLWVSLSRISDHRHHPHDVIAGALAGILAATVSFLVYVPKPDSPFETSDNDVIAL